MRDLTSQVFGKLTVIKFTAKRSSRSPIWECKCECGILKNVQACHLISGHTKSCGCLHVRICREKLTSYHKYRSDNNMRGCRWNGIGNLYSTYVGGLKAGAKRRHLDFLVTNDYLWNLFVKQKELCAMTGIPIALAYKSQTASLDRIDSSKGYIEGNLQWVHKNINKMRMNLDIDTFTNYCKLIVEYGKEKHS